MDSMSDVAFADAADVESIRYRLAPIDVGFDLRAQGMTVDMSDAEDPVRVSYADERGDRRVVSGPRRTVIARLRRMGYQILVRSSAR